MHSTWKSLRWQVEAAGPADRALCTLSDGVRQRPCFRCFRLQPSHCRKQLHGTDLAERISAIAADTSCKARQPCTHWTLHALRRGADAPLLQASRLPQAAHLDQLVGISPGDPVAQALHVAALALQEIGDDGAHELILGQQSRQASGDCLAQGLRLVPACRLQAVPKSSRRSAQGVWPLLLLLGGSGQRQTAFAAARPAPGARETAAHTLARCCIALSTVCWSWSACIFARGKCATRPGRTSSARLKGAGTRRAVAR